METPDISDLPLGRKVAASGTGRAHVGQPKITRWARRAGFRGKSLFYFLELSLPIHTYSRFLIVIEKHLPNVPDGAQQGFFSARRLPDRVCFLPDVIFHFHLKGATHDAYPAFI